MSNYSILFKVDSQNDESIKERRESKQMTTCSITKTTTMTSLATTITNTSGTIVNSSKNPADIYESISSSNNMLNARTTENTSIAQSFDLRTDNINHDDTTNYSTKHNITNEIMTNISNTNINDKSTTSLENNYNKTEVAIVKLAEMEVKEDNKESAYGSEYNIHKDCDEEVANIPETYNNNISGQEILYIPNKDNDEISHNKLLTSSEIFEAKSLEIFHAKTPNPTFDPNATLEEFDLLPLKSNLKKVFFHTRHKLLIIN